MKVPRVFGVVVILHVIVITFVLVQPGCRTKPAPTPSATATTSEPASELDPTLAPEFNPVGETVAWAPAPAPAPAGTGARQAPTRPSVSLGTSSVPADRLEGTVSTAPSVTHTVERGDSPWKISQRYKISVDELLEANNLSRGSTIRPGQVLIIPGRATSVQETVAAAPAPATQPPSAAAGSAVTYTVRPGDTLSAIAARHGTTVAALRSANGLTQDMIRVGQVLSIPGTGTPPAAAAAVAAPEAIGGATHTVASGETPGGIARRYGVTTDALLRVNNITDPRRLRVGQVLVIPGGTAAAAAPRPVTPQPTVAPASDPARPPTAAELEAQLRAVEDVEILPVDDAPLVPVTQPPPPRP